MHKTGGVMLEGTKVLSFTHYMQGPSSAQVLADLGAEVVKVEAPKGAFERSWSGCNTYPGGVSMFFLLGNRNQTAISINLKSPEGKKIIYELVKEYDVVIENFRAGVMEKLGLGYEDLRKVNPKLIYCSCSGYGSSGPYVDAKKPGQDLLIQSMSGLVSLTGSNPNIPSPVGTPIVDQHGAVLAALGITASILDRERTGKGHKVEASLLGSALDLQQEALGYYMNGGQFTERPSTGLSTRLHQSPYGVYQTKDGCLTLGATSVDKLQVMFTPGCMDSYTEEDQMFKRIEFDKLVCQEMKKKTTAEWMKIFDEQGIWYAPVNDYDTMLEDPQVKYNNNILTMHHPVAGDVRVVGHANKYDGKNIEIRKLPPKLGESTQEILKKLGYSEETIKEYKNNGIVNWE